MPKPVMICLLFLTLAACASGNRNSPDFKAGYSDGCASANTQGSADPRKSGVQRDEAAYRANKNYHAGWSQGFGVCRAMSRPASPGAGPFGPATP